MMGKVDEERMFLLFFHKPDGLVGEVFHPFISRLMIIRIPGNVHIIESVFVFPLLE